MSPGPETHPPQQIEKVVRFLIPPACREHVLGDLCERYKSPLQYVFDAFRILPFVIAGQISKTSDSRLLLIQMADLYLSFLAAAQLMTGSSPLDPSTTSQLNGLLRVAIPATVALIALIFRDAYAGNRRGGAAIAVGFALFTEYILWIAARGLMLPQSTMIAGAILSALTLSATRLAFRLNTENPNAPAGGAMSPLDTLRQNAQELHRKTWLLNLIWMVAASFILLMNPIPLAFRNRGGLLLLLAGGLMAWWRYKNGLARKTDEYLSVSIVEDPYRNLLKRKRDALRLWAGGGEAPSSYQAVSEFLLLILAVPLIAFPSAWILGMSESPDFYSSPIGRHLLAFAAMLVSWLFLRKLNERAARAIQQEIDALDGREPDAP